MVTIRLTVFHTHSAIRLTPSDLRIFDLFLHPCTDCHKIWHTTPSNHVFSIGISRRAMQLRFVWKKARKASDVHFSSWLGTHILASAMKILLFTQPFKAPAKQANIRGYVATFVTILLSFDFKQSKDLHTWGRSFLLFTGRY